jgi:hypothetical protein
MNITVSADHARATLHRTFLGMCALLFAPCLSACDDALEGRECEREMCEQEQELGHDGEQE